MDDENKMDSRQSYVEINIFIRDKPHKFAIRQLGVNDSNNVDVGRP